MIQGTRSNAYDGMRGLIDRVHVLLKETKAIIQKSEEEHRGFGAAKIPEEVSENKLAIDGLCNFISAQFYMCKQDFENGKINQLRYVGYLKDLNHLLVGSGKKIDSKLLDSKIMASEIRKYTNGSSEKTY